jgi:hypothetical protein
VTQVTFQPLHEAIWRLEATRAHDGMDLRPHLEHLIDGRAGRIASSRAQASLTRLVGWRHAHASPPEPTQIRREVVLFGEDQVPNVLHRRPFARWRPIVQTRELDGSEHFAEGRLGIFDARKGCERTGFVRHDSQIYACADARSQAPRPGWRCYVSQRQLGCEEKKPRETLSGFAERLMSGSGTGIRTPVLALRGPRPGPLDDTATPHYWLGREDSNPRIRIQSPLSYH